MRNILVAVMLALLALTGQPGHATQASEAPVRTEASAPKFHEPTRIVARISISHQRMEVFHEGRKLFDWPVSTARRGKITPLGTWNGAQWLSRNHRSSLYNGAPMPYAIFFNGNYAIHGTDQIRKLGNPASAGCIRLHPTNARILFNMVRHEGKKNIRVEVVR